MSKVLNHNVESTESHEEETRWQSMLQTPVLGPIVPTNTRLTFRIFSSAFHLCHQCDDKRQMTLKPSPIYQVLGS